MQQADAAKRGFIGLWLALLVLKGVLAATMPLFADEAFYWQEGRHLAWAYSDLPGLTAWLARLGDALAPGHALALRLPFLLLAAGVPWLVVGLSAREFGARAGWWAGTLCVLLPLAGSLGVMALPDVPLLLASALCLDAGLRLLRTVDAWAAAELALGLVIGGLTHYRFAAVIVVGLIALLFLQEGRRALRAPVVWWAIALGALAWLPLLIWNQQHADAGLRFQLLDRHPWAFSHGGWILGLLQLLTATPLLLWAMLVAGKRGWGDTRPAVRYLACTGTLLIFGFLLLGFFADQQRVSFHWPLPGFVALLPLAAMALLAANARLRWATTVLAGLGLALVVGFFVILSVPAWRTRVAVAGAQVGNFAGWDTLAQAVQQRRAQLPAGTRVLAGDFKIAAELGYLTGDASLPVLTHPVNDKHGRAVQLALWQLLHDTRASLSPGPWLLVASPSHAGFNGDQGYLRRLQQQLGPLPLPPPQVLQVDGGTKQYWLFVLPAVATAK
jgi:4-amino-4-deoxy-L-arabinose transferase-like glycosyltransferase